MSAKKTKVKSEYNPEGLMVGAIIDQIRSAFEYDYSLPYNPADGLDGKGQRSIVEYDTGPELDIQRDGEQSDNPKLAVMTVRRKANHCNLLECDELSICEEDERLAAEIRKHPMHLLFSRVHADAAARWTYAQTYAVRPETRTTAKELLRLARPENTTGGAPKRFDGKKATLREARKTLIRYGDGLRSCLRENKIPDTLYSHFPDCSRLSEAGCTDPVCLLGKRAKEIPTGRKLAGQVFAHIVGWGRTQIENKLYPKQSK